MSGKMTDKAKNKNAKMLIFVKTPRVPVSTGEVQLVPDNVLLQVKMTLRLEEVVSVLRVSESEVRKLVKAGTLQGSETRPITVTTASVIRHLVKDKGFDPLDLGISPARIAALGFNPTHGVQTE